MLDLDAIRRRWAATPWTNGRSPELAADMAAMFSEVDRLRAAVARLQDLADARLYRARTARIALESVGCPHSEPVDVSAARAAGMIEDLRAEVARLTAALAAAQAAPVVEWPAPLSWTLVHRDGRRVWITMRGAFTFDVLDVPDPEYAVGWFMAVNDAHPSDEGWGGPETGPAGKAACEAAYRRACGLPAIPPCAG